MIKLMDLLNEYNINKPGKYIIPVPNNEGANFVSELGIDYGYYIRPTTYKNFKETIKNNFEEGDIEMYMDRFNSYPDNDINIENYTDDQLLDIIINEFGYVILNTEKEVEDYFEFLDSAEQMDNNYEEEAQQIFNSIDSADDTIWKIWSKPQFLNTFNEYKINQPNSNYKLVLGVVESYNYDDEDIMEDFLKEFPEGKNISKDQFFEFFSRYVDDMSEYYYMKQNWKYVESGGDDSVYDEEDEDDDDDDEEELAEYEIKKPILFNTDSSKSKLWVDYNPKIRKIDSKELSLLNRVYSALKPVENRLDDSLRLSPSLDRVMMKYGYWEWIEDREILKALKDFNVEIEDDYDDDRGQTTYYMVKDK